MSARTETHFQRAAVMLEATRIAEVFRAAATQLDDLAATAHGFEVGTLRRKVRGVVLTAVAAAVGADE